jgi:hypothetical protein
MFAGLTVSRAVTMANLFAENDAVSPHLIRFVYQDSGFDSNLLYSITITPITIKSLANLTRTQLFNSKKEIEKAGNEGVAEVG